MHCQKCRTALQLDKSLDDLNPAAYDLLLAAHSQQAPKGPHSCTLQALADQTRRPLYDRVARNAGQPVFKKYSGPRRGGDSHARDSQGVGSFVLLTDSQYSMPGRRHADAAPSQPRQHKQSGRHDAAAPGSDESSKAGEMERITKLFEILSARSDIDHPVCVECAELLASEMQKKLEATGRERDIYVAFLKDLKANAPTDEEVCAQQEALDMARKDEAAAQARLKGLEKEKKLVDTELLALEEESRQLDREEDKFWRERNAFASQLADFQNERDSVNSKFDHDSQLLEKLHRSNVYNDTFTISHDGTFATINGLRLGRLASKPVDWPEINAAWGHALLLLATVADKLGFRFESYELQPMGSTSRIVRLDTPSPSLSRMGGHRNAASKTRPHHVLDLFSSGDMPLGLTFMHRKFDLAMVAFLELVRQLGTYVQRQTATEGAALSLPYKIEGDRIGDVSIKLGIAQDDGWSKACKLTLTCCKFLLAHASNVSSAASANAAQSVATR